MLIRSTVFGSFWNGNPVVKDSLPMLNLPPFDYWKSTEQNR